MIVGTLVLLAESTQSQYAAELIREVRGYYAGRPMDLKIAEAIASLELLPWVLIVGTVIASASILLLLHVRLSRPLRILMDGVRRYTSGDRDVRIAITTNDEVEELAEAFNALTAKLRREEVRTREQVVRDPLTGAYNRRYLQESLLAEIDRSTRTNRSFGVLMIDVDHFKAFNDRCGHQAGDETLQRVAMVLKGTFRRMDTIARYGGEEFAIVLPEVDQKVAAEAAERMRVAVEASPFPGGEGQPGGRLTVSVGVASYPRDGADLDEILAAADRRLYRAKARGRNCVVSDTEGTGRRDASRTSVFIDG